MNDSNRSHTESAFRAEGYVPPKEMSDVMALRRAMESCCNEKTYRAESRKRPQKNGIELLSIHRGDDSNEYNMLYGAKVIDGRVELERSNYQLQYKLQDAFDTQKATFTGGAIGEALILACKSLDGSTELRPGGCIYWLPQYSLEKWNRLVGRLGQVNPRNVVHQWATAQDENTLHEVRDALMREVQDASTRILNDLHTKALREDGIEARRDEANELIAKTERYAALLGERLDEIRQVAELARQCCVHDAICALGM